MLQKKKPSFEAISFGELKCVLAFLYFMEIYKLSQRRMYWEVKEDGIIPPMNCGWYKSRGRVEDILRCLQLSLSDSKDEQVTGFIDAFNKDFKKALCPGNTIGLDESMIKLFHCGLK